MAILDLRNVHLRRTDGLFKSASRVIDEATRTPLDKQWDVFLSYSSRDREALPRVRQRLEDEGLDVYVDFVADADLDPLNVDADTARRLRWRLRRSRALFVLTSRNSMRSRWIPWELGFADGARKRVAVLPFIDERELLDTFEGNEYLGLYPYIDDAFDRNEQTHLWVNDRDRPDLYRRLDLWLEGKPLAIYP